MDNCITFYSCITCSNVHKTRKQYCVGVNVLEWGGTKRRIIFIVRHLSPFVSLEHEIQELKDKQANKMYIVTIERKAEQMAVITCIMNDMV